MKPSSKGGKERPVVLVHDCDAVWALVEDQFADGPMLNHPSLITIPNGGRYILRKLLYNFVVEAAAPTEYVFTPDRHIHRTPFLHIKLVNVDLVTDVRAKRTELLKWAERLEREEYLIILMHPTLVQQPVQAARPSKDEKKSALDIMFSRRSPLEQAKHKLAETEARLKEKFKRVYTLWHAKDARDLFVEVRACVISTFNCRLQHSLNVAARLKNQWTKNKLSTAATNICPYVSVMDDVAGLLMKFGLSVEVSACYERLAAVLHALSSDFASASFVSVPSTYTPDPSHFCSLFTIDTANPKFAALTKRLKDCEIEALQNATPPSSPSCAAEGPAAVTATTPPPSELDVRIFSFVRHVSACLHHEAALGTEGPAKALAMFSRGFLPRVAKVLRARGVSAGAQTGTELALQIAFANMLSQLGKGFVGFGTASSPPVPPTQAQPEPAAVAAAAAAATAAAAPAAEAAEAAAAAATATTGVSSDAGSDDASSVDDAAEAQPDTADAASRSNAGASPSPPPTPTAAPAPAPSADGRQTPPDAAVVSAPNGERRRRALLRDSKEVYKALHKAYIDLVLQAKCTYVVLGRQYGCNVPADVRHVSSSDMKEGQATAAPKLTQVWVAAASSEEDDETSPCPLGFEALRNQEAFTAAHLQFCLHAMHHCESAGRVHTQHTLVREALPCFAACGYVAPCVSLLQSQISYYDTHGWSRLATEARSKLVTLLQGLVPLIAEQDPALAAVVVGSSAGPEERQRGFARLLRLWGTSLLQLLDSGGGGGSVPGSSDTLLPSSMQKQHWDWLLSAGDLFGQTMNVTFPLSPFATLLSVELSTDAPATASENNGIAACVACRVQLAAALLEGVAVRAELQLHNTKPSGGRSLILTCDRVTIRAADDDDAAASVLSVSCKGEPVGTGTYSGGLLRLLFKREEGSSVADIVVQHTFSSGVAAARGATPECDDAGGAPTCTGVHKLFDGEVLSTASEKRPRSVRWDDGAVSSDHADGPTPRSRRPSTRKAGQKDDAAARWHKTPSSPAPRATRSAEVFENNERILENVIVRITPRFWAEHCRLSLACCSVIAPEHRFSNTEDVLVLALRKTTAFGNAPLTGLQGERLSLTLRDGSQTEVSLGGTGPAGAALVGLLVVEASPAPDTPPPLVAEAGEGFSVEVADATDRSTLLRFDTQEYLQPAPVSLCSTLQVVATAEHPTAVFLVYLAQSPEAEREQHWDVVLPLMPTVYNQMLSVSFVYHLRRRFEVPPLLCSMLEMQIPFTQAFACTLHVKCNEGLVHVQVMLVNQIQSDLVLLGFTPSFGGYDEQAITGDDEGPSGAYKIVRRPQEQAAGTLLKPGDSACRVFTLAADTADTEKTVTPEDCCLYVSARYVLADSDDECVNTFRCGKSTWDVPKQETIAASIDLVGSAAGDAVVARPLRFEVAVRLVDADAAAHYSVSLSFPLTQWLIVGYLRRRIVLTADCPTAAFSVHLAPIAHGNIQAPTIKIAPLNTPTSFVSVRVRQSHSRVLVRRPS